MIINVTEAQENKIDRDTAGGSFVHCWFVNAIEKMVMLTHTGEVSFNY